MKSRFLPWQQAASAAIGLILTILCTGSWAFGSPGAAWQTYSDRLVLEAQKLNNPVIINFHADWCLLCIQLKQKTFNHSDFARVSKGFLLLSVDLTDRSDPAVDKIIKRYGIRSVPTILFLNSRGIEYRDVRVENYIAPQELKKIMLTLHPK